MLRKWYCQAELKIRIEPIDPLLVKSGYASFTGPDMVPVSILKGRDDEEYYLPGTSLKGVFRSHLEQIGRSLRDGVICLPYYHDPQKDADAVPVASERDAVGCSARLEPVPQLPEGQKISTATAYRYSCPVCRMFGSLKFGGRATFSDARAIEKPQPDIRNHVAIDRFTGGAVGGALFDMTVLVGGAYETTFTITNFELWQLAAIRILLDDLEDGLLHVGSGQSRGLGRVTGRLTGANLSYLRSPEQLSGLAELASAEDVSAYGLFPWSGDRTQLAPLPAGTRRGLRSVHDVGGQWHTLTDPLLPAFADFLDWYADTCGPMNQHAARLSGKAQG